MDRVELASKETVALTLERQQQYDISVVIPVYGAPKSLHELCQRINNTMQANSWSYEIILVNDACPKNSWTVIEVLCNKDQHIKGINLSRNYGQHYAISAGLAHALGNITFVMDCDLQDRPEHIPDFVTAIKNGKDLVFGRSTVRGTNNRLTQFTSALFYKVFGFLSNNSEFSFNASYVGMKQEVVQAINALGENQRQFLGLLQYIGFDYGFIEIQHSKRKEGKSSYNLIKRLELAFKSITNSSTRLLKTGILIGTLCSTFSFSYGIYLIVKKLFLNSLIQGWTSSIVSTFFVGGIIMILVGIVGIYIEVIFWEVKKRPVYLIKNKKNI